MKFIKNSEAPVQQRKLSIQWSGIQQNGKKKYLWATYLIKNEYLKFIIEFINSTIKVWAKSLNKQFSRKQKNKWPTNTHTHTYSQHHCQGNPNQKHSEIAPHPCANAYYYSKDKEYQKLVRLWKRRNFYGGNINESSQGGKQDWNCLEN